MGFVAAFDKVLFYNPASRYTVLRLKTADIMVPQSLLFRTHIERVFADAKEKHVIRYTQYRGLAQVTNWVRLKFVAVNLKKLARWK